MRLPVFQPSANPLAIMDVLTQLCSQNLKWSVNGNEMTMNGFNEKNKTAGKLLFNYMFLKILYLKDGMYQLSTISYLLHHVSIVFLQLLIYFGFTYMSIREPLPAHFQD